MYSIFNLIFRQDQNHDGTSNKFKFFMQTNKSQKVIVHVTVCRLSFDKGMFQVKLGPMGLFSYNEK